MADVTDPPVKNPPVSNEPVSHSPVSHSPSSHAAVPPEAVAWDARGLAPAIVQDAKTGEVLMLAWQNREALARTLATGEATFFSRSRDALWIKGATSGNRQAVHAVATDCDADAILLRVTAAGPACHTGERSCFFRAVAGGPGLAAESAALDPAQSGATESVAVATESVAAPARTAAAAAAAAATESVAAEASAPAARPGAVLAALEAVLESRRESPPPGSYAAKLFANETLRHKKVGEEATELIIASLGGDKEQIAGEAADLFFHALVLLRAHGLGLADVEHVLHARENAPRRG